MTRIAIPLLAAFGILLVMPAAFARLDEKPEINKFYAHFQDVVNSDAFAKDPTIGLRFFDEKKVRLFDVMKPTEYTGADFRKHFIDISLAIPAKTDFGDLDVHVDGNVAFVIYNQHLTGKTSNGQEIDFFMRTTDGLEKGPNGWRIVHEHVSIPLDEATFQAMIKKR